MRQVLLHFLSGTPLHKNVHAPSTLLGAKCCSPLGFHTIPSWTRVTVNAGAMVDPSAFLGNNICTITTVSSARKRILVRKDCAEVVGSLNDISMTSPQVRLRSLYRRFYSQTLFIAKVTNAKALEVLFCFCPIINPKWRGWRKYDGAA